MRSTARSPAMIAAARKKNRKSWVRAQKTAFRRPCALAASPFFFGFSSHGVYLLTNGQKSKEKREASAAQTPQRNKDGVGVVCFVGSHLSPITRTSTPTARRDFGRKKGKVLRDEIERRVGEVASGRAQTKAPAAPRAHRRPKEPRHRKGKTAPRVRARGSAPQRRHRHWQPLVLMRRRANG